MHLRFCCAGTLRPSRYNYVESDSTAVELLTQEVL
jgi:hypothetical protein